MNERINAAELSRRLNVTRGAVSKAVKSGRITPGEDGLFDAEQAAREWQANTRPNMKASASPAATAKGTSYTEARARKETAHAAMSELRLMKAKGALIPRDAAEYAMDNLATTIRVRLETVPDRWHAILAPITDLAEIRESLMTMIEEELRAVSETLNKRAQELQAMIDGSKNDQTMPV